MEEEETASLISRKELRKQKLMEYLAQKGRLKLPNAKPYLRVDQQLNATGGSSQKIFTGKENKGPSDALKYETTKKTTVATQATKLPVGKAFGIMNKVDLKSSILTRQKNANRPPEASGSAQLNRNPVLTGVKTALSSKSNSSAASNNKTQLNRAMPSSFRATSNASGNSRFRRGPTAAWSAPEGTSSLRISLGPMVKTKTGLIPVVTQPKNTKSHSTLPFTSTANILSSTTTSAAKKQPPSSSLTVSQKSTVVVKKTASAYNPVSRRCTYSSTKIIDKLDNENNASLKPPVGKPPLAAKGQTFNGLKSVPLKCKAAPVKHEGRGKIPIVKKSASEVTDRLLKQKSVVGEDKNMKLRKVPMKVSLPSRPTSSCSVRAVSGVRQGVVTEPEGRSKTSKENQRTKVHSGGNPPVPQADVKKTGGTVMSERLIRTTKSFSHAGPSTDMRTPQISVRVIPKTEVKKVTAAQEERVRKLQEWREARGISYKRPPMPAKQQVRRTLDVPQPFWTAMKEEDDAHSLISAVDRSLADCIKLLEEGCPPEQVKEVLSRLPKVSQKFAKYWICQVRLMEQEGNLEVLPIFEEAVRVVLEPVDELRAVVFDILKKRDKMQASEANEKEEDGHTTTESSLVNCSGPMMTPKPVRVLISEEKGPSSTVKYKITATPGGPLSQKREAVRLNGQEVRFLTPVRRSVRIERTSLQYPASLQDHDVCVTSFSDLISEEEKGEDQEEDAGKTSGFVHDTPMYVYRENEALKDKILVQLVYD